MTDLCLICGQPTKWHVIDRETVTCAEVRIQLSGKTPRYRSCRAAMAAFYKLPKSIRETPERPLLGSLEDARKQLKRRRQ